MWVDQNSWMDGWFILMEGPSIHGLMTAGTPMTQETTIEADAQHLYLL